MKLWQSKRKGLTKKQYKKQYKSETPGSEKSECCKATALDKAMAKYPRSHKNYPTEYTGWYLKKYKHAKNLPINHYFT